jgi:hypothetical protein
MSVSLVETAVSVIQDPQQWLLIKAVVQAFAFIAVAIFMSRREPGPDDVFLFAFLAVAGLVLTGTIENVNVAKQDSFTKIIDCVASNLSTLALGYGALILAGRGEFVFAATSVIWALSHFYQFVADNGEEALFVAEAADSASCFLAGSAFGAALAAKVKHQPLAYGLTLSATIGWAVTSAFYWWPDAHWAKPMIRLAMLSTYVATVAATLYVTRRPPLARVASTNHGALEMHAG